MHWEDLHAADAIIFGSPTYMEWRDKIAGGFTRDLAALNKVEMLPWDVWGAQPRPEQPLDDAFFDRLAALTSASDTSFEELRKLYEGDSRVVVPATVFNAVLNHLQASDS